MMFVVVPAQDMDDMVLLVVPTLVLNVRAE